jgi:predicted dithiol-disulfide oxidoreductase (DUF899 family)
MKYALAARRLRAYRRRIGAIRARMRAVQRGIEPEPVEDYAFATAGGPRRLSELFGRHRDLFVIHNMGSSCPYCTLWADGFNGLFPHLRSRAAFVVTSPDSPGVQQRFARGRGWRFPMVSHAGTTFAADMGYRSRAGFRPGISAFQRAGARVVRVSDASLSPGDDFCALWHVLELLPEGPAGWRPKLRYPERSTPSPHRR